MTVVSVGRGGKEIGDYDLDGLRQGLASGFFLPDDWGWYEGLPEWLPLSQIVAKLSPPLSPTVISVPPPIGRVTPTPSPLPPLPRMKQNLKPKDGEVSYVLKETKRKRKKAEPSPPHSWEDDPATEKQIAFLKNLGARTIPPTLTKGQAHNQIDALLGHSRGQAHTFLSPKQQACLHYYGFDLSALNYDEAMALLERVHESPESFDVSEPWETAKYRLYPKLYPSSGGKKPRGCLTLLFLIIVSVCVVVLVASHNTSSETNAPSMPAGAPGAVPVITPPASNEQPSDESPYHGTADKDFAKDWVVVTGKRIEGITQVNPAPNGQVEILFSSGVGKYPASSLPQGFLDAWQLTPERLKAEDNQ